MFLFPFFFFFLPSFRPFPQNSTFLLSSLSFSSCGGGWKGEGEGRGGRMRGRGASEPRPPGGRGRGPRSSPARRDPRGRAVPTRPASFGPRLRVGAAVGAATVGQKGPRALPGTPLRGPDSPFAAGYCLGLGQVASAAPWGKGRPGAQSRRGAGGAGCWSPDQELPSFPRRELEFPLVTVGLRDPRGTRQLALPKVLSRPQRPRGVLGCAPRGRRGRDFGMGTANVEMAHVTNQCSPVS